MKGKTVLITGANSGIGLETAWALAHMEAHIVMASRNVEKSAEAKSMIEQESGNRNIDIMPLDLASFDSIKEFSREFLKSFRRLHVLINNAGAVFMRREESVDGIEKTFATNYIGPFLLTNLLLPVLKKTPEARIVIVSSDSHRYGTLSLKDPFMKKSYGLFRAYAASKLALNFFTRELSERLSSFGITVNALNPGHVETNIWPETTGVVKLIMNFTSRNRISAGQGARTSIYLAASDEVKGVTGKYFDKMKETAFSKKCNNPEMQKALWDLSEKLTGLS